MTTTETHRPVGVPAPGTYRGIRSTAPPGRRRRPALPAQLTGTGTSSVVLSWLVSRALALALLLTAERNVTADVAYYARSLKALVGGGSLHDALPEYPLPVLGVLLPQYLLGALNSVAFGLLFAASMLAVDAAFTGLLWRVSGQVRSDAVRLWLWFVPIIGPMAYYRFDLVPAALAGAAVLAAIRRPALTGVLTAAGAGLKLWPAIMLPVFLIRRVDRGRVLAGFGAAGFAVAAVGLAAGGPGRLLSPLHYQGARGLQIESVPAMPLMLARALDPAHGPWTLRISQYKAWEVYGPGVHPLAVLSTPLMVAGVGLLAWLWWRARALPAASGETLAWLLLASALVMTVTNKTLSPQYVLWLGGPLCALMARWPGGPGVRQAAGVLLLVSALTQLEYPVLYPSLTGHSWVTPVVTGVVAVRNVLLVLLAWLACRQVWRQTRAPSELLDGRVAQDEPLRTG